MQRSRRGLWIAVAAAVAVLCCCAFLVASYYWIGDWVLRLFGVG